MIRWRIPEKDDARLVGLVIGRLIPLAREARPDTSISRTEIRRRLRSQKVLVACPKGGLPQGFVSFKTKGGILSIEMLAVDRRAEGKGLGSALIGAAERYAKRAGAAYSKLAVDEPNVHAQGFYERKGYALDTYMPEYRMFVLTKRL